MTRNHALQVGYFSLHLLSRGGCLGGVCLGVGVSSGTCVHGGVQGEVCAGWVCIWVLGVCVQGYMSSGLLSRGQCVSGGVHPPRPEADTSLPPVNRMADRCKNITLPQTSFAGGKS